MTAKLKKKTVQPKAAPEYPEAVVPVENNIKGAIRITEGAIATIVRRAACSVDGVTRITGNAIVDNLAEFVGHKRILDRSIQIDVNGAEIAIELSINISYGVSLPAIASNVQREVATQIQNLTALKVTRVNVIIREMDDIQ